MSVLFLTASELVELTGFRAPRCQARWLDKNRWRFALDRTEKPKVARNHFNERMGAPTVGAVNQVNQALNLEQPDFEALNRH